MTKKAATAKEQTAKSSTDEHELDVEKQEEGAPEPTAPEVPETRPCPLNLEKYLRDEIGNETQEFRLIGQKNEAGDVVFYIHPLNKDGKSRDFTVMGELVRNVTRLAV